MKYPLRPTLNFVTIVAIALSTLNSCGSKDNDHASVQDARDVEALGKHLPSDSQLTEPSPTTSDGKGHAVNDVEYFRFPNFMMVGIVRSKADDVSMNVIDNSRLAMVPNHGELLFSYGDNRYMVTSKDCRNREILINGVMYKGEGVVIYQDGTLSSPAASNNPLLRAIEK
ncbi:hypothetical protein [Planctomycetes bacterium Poly30]|uniref:hypothetical protein n=1 Tax=Saltatorellus ferox TaxID=2528018 RepID=UPI0011AA475C